MVTAAALLLCPEVLRADQGGASFWLPGTYGSLVAVPQTPGWSLAVVYYHYNVAASGNVAASKEILTGRLPSTVNVNLNLSLRGQADLVTLTPSYAFATPVLGGQLSVSISGQYGRNAPTIAGTLTALAGPIVMTRTGMLEDSLTSYGDLVPNAELLWNYGVNNYMAYVTGDIPAASYNSMRLANIGIGYWAIDTGAGYTYLNPATGIEFSAVAGFTYNFKNSETQYRNGVDFHFDWGASHLLSKQLFVGLAGYAFQQITDDFRSKPDSGRLQIACSWCRSADWILLPGGRHAGLFESESLWRVRRGQPGAWLEHLADVRHFAGRAHRCGAADQAIPDEIREPSIAVAVAHVFSGPRSTQVRQRWRSGSCHEHIMRPCGSL